MSVKHSQYIDWFLQYLWSDLLENQDLSKELIDVLNEAGSKLKEAKTLLIEKEPVKQVRNNCVDRFHFSLKDIDEVEKQVRARKCELVINGVAA